MSKKRIQTGDTPQLIVSCLGNLNLRGWAEAAVLIGGDEHKWFEKEGLYHLECPGDLSLMVPAAATIEVRRVAGDLAAKNIAGRVVVAEASGDAIFQNLGPLEAHRIHGDLAVRTMSDRVRVAEVMGDASLRNVMAVTLERVHGDCVLQNVRGYVTATEILGDISLKTVSGAVTLDTVHRDVNLYNLGGPSTVSQVHGDLRLRGGLTAGKHHYAASGDIVIRWPVGAPLTLEAKASQIHERMSLDEVTRTEETLRGHIGSGDAVVHLEAGGRLMLKDLEAVEDWEDLGGMEDWDALGVELAGLGEHIANEINSRMSELSVRLERDLGPELAARLEQKAQRAAAKAEKAAERAMRKAEKAARRARWQSRTARYRRPAAPSEPPKPKTVTSEEQLRILKMVEQGIITPEEASELLEAIEG